MINRRHVLLAASAALFAPAACAAPPARAMTVFKDASCGCCSAWIDHMTKAGFKAEGENVDDLSAVKAKYAVPDDLASCHTGVIDGYVVEGHVPAADVARLLKERPKAIGIAVGGMPVNSPGMEVPGQPDEPYTVWLFQKDGTRTAFAKHGEA